MNRFSGIRVALPVAGLTLLAAMSAPTQAQVAVGLDLAAPIAPLNKITVPDVNVLGILDGGGPVAGADAWPDVFGGAITNANQRKELQQLGKALFWDMQVGGDGIQGCATCHYHAGADNRRTNQMSPGLKRTVGGPDVPASNSDTVQDLLGPNRTLTVAHFTTTGQAAGGIPVSEAALIAGGSLADGVDGTSGVPGGTKPDASLDVNDVVSSQGVRLGAFESVGAGRVDGATLAVDDDGFDGFSGFTVPRRSDSVDTVHTVRRVEPRNTPTALNAVYNLRNFWDGRADVFFNGVNPLGFRDPDARVKVYQGGSLSDQKLRIPFSSLASQAVGPIESNFEMVFTGRPHRDLGKKLLAAGVVPLAGQAVSSSDSLLAGLVLGSGRGLTTFYRDMIEETFNERFWGDGSGNDVCLDNTAAPAAPVVVDCLVDDGAGNITLPNPLTDYTLMEWNFSLFFGLAVQAYEATLTTEQTIVDLLVGGVAEGSVVNATAKAQRIVPVAGLPLAACIARAALSTSAAAQGVAQDLCTQHYAQWIHKGAVAGSEAGLARFPVPAGTAIGGCAASGDRDLMTTTTLPKRGPRVTDPFCQANSPSNAQLIAARRSLLNIDRGMGRFFAGATGCGICHFNPEFTGATVATLTGFGAAPPPPLPPGQVRKIAPEVPLERMVAFNAAVALYDSGFYNLGVRPTPEDLSIGAEIGGVPLAFTKLAELVQAGPLTAPSPYDPSKIVDIAGELAINPGDGLNGLLIPTAATNLAPRAFTLALACGPGIQGGGAGEPNNNPIPNCGPTVVPGERLLRNGAFKAQGLRSVKYTGPYMHNGAKLNLRQVVNFYETAGQMVNLNLNNLDAGLRAFALGAADDASLLEFLETGLTDWRVAYEEDKFDHPEICVPHGHAATGETLLAGIPAVGSGGSTSRLQTFEEQLRGTVSGRTHTLADPCTVPGISSAGLSTIDTPPAP